jgi:predicted thioesterase
VECSGRLRRVGPSLSSLASVAPKRSQAIVLGEKVDLEKPLSKSDGRRVSLSMIAMRIARPSQVVQSVVLEIAARGKLREQSHGVLRR